jgi:orotate phosphoribosyltransferase
MNLTENQNELLAHLQANGLYTEGPYRLSSGLESNWYVDGRQTTFDGAGARIVASCVLEVLDDSADVVGGMTMGADPIAVATAVMADRPLRAFSVRKEVKEHGTGGRLVGPVVAGDRAVVVEDAVTTGASMAAAVEALRAEGIEVVQAIVLVDRSDGAAAELMDGLGVPLIALLLPEDLGVTE